MFGQTWGYGATLEDAKRITQGFVDVGGNFIDTADNYQHGDSETVTGDAIASNRDDFVIASKFTRGASINPALAHLGNKRKNMVQSVEASLKRLKTDRIDLYFRTWTTRSPRSLRSRSNITSCSALRKASCCRWPKDSGSA
jgi:aryl-alcohol dehydrogenase-like predicted oxidoreductase